MNEEGGEANAKDKCKAKDTPDLRYLKSGVSYSQDYENKQK